MSKTKDKPKGLDMFAAGARRREITLRVLRLKAGDTGLTQRELMGFLKALHEAGKWPQSTANGARNEPYDTGTRQHLWAMHAQGRVLRVVDESGIDRWKLPEPADFLPANPERFRNALCRAIAGGLKDVVLGVTEDCKRVVRIDTGRGEIERWLQPDEKWEHALAEVGIEV